MDSTSHRRPNWDLLFEAASAQEGLFSVRQGAEAGYSPQLLIHHVKAGRAVRVRRGIYRLVHFPAGEHEDLVATWLWSEREGVFSHQTALALHDLSDALPSRTHLTLPLAWRRKRLRVPDRVVIHHADVPKSQRAWFGAVPATGAARTLNDCAQDGHTPDLLRQGARDALKRGMVTRRELKDVAEALRPYGGLSK